MTSITHSSSIHGNKRMFLQRGIPLIALKTAIGWESVGVCVCMCACVCVFVCPGSPKSLLRTRTWGMRLIMSCMSWFYFCFLLCFHIPYTIKHIFHIPAKFCFYFLFFVWKQVMQQQRSQKDSCIHERLIANINFGPCTKTKKKFDSSSIPSHLHAI